MPLGIVVDNPDQDSGHVSTDPFAGLVGNLKSLQAEVNVNVCSNI